MTADVIFDNRILGLHLSKLKGKAVFFGGQGSALHDNFQTFDQVDLALLENASVSVAGKIATAYTGSVPIIPDMTSDTAPSPFAAAAKSTYSWSGGGAAWKAFDRDNNSGWLNAVYESPDLPTWLSIMLDAVTEIGSFSIRSRHTNSATYNGFPIDFELQGWTGSAWENIQTYEGVSWSIAETKTFPVSASYIGYRLYITETSTGNATINEFQLYTPSEQTAVIVSKGIIAAAIPETVRCAVIASHTGVLNTDFKVFASRDNGVTWTQATLTHLYQNEDGYGVYDTGDVDVTAQPSGSTIRWKIEVNNAASADVDGVAVWCN